MYQVEINAPFGWVVVCSFIGPEDHLDMAAATARRYTLSSKCNSRVCESYFGHNRDLSIVYEYFYDRDQDPDARDDPWDIFNEEENNISWQECGF